MAYQNLGAVAPGTVQAIASPLLSAKMNQIEAAYTARFQAIEKITPHWQMGRVSSATSVYAGPGTLFGVTATLPAGSTRTITARYGDWLKIPEGYAPMNAFTQFIPGPTNAQITASINKNIPRAIGLGINKLTDLSNAGLSSPGELGIIVRAVMAELVNLVVKDFA